MRSLFYVKSFSAMIASHSTKTRFWISSSNHPYEAAIKKRSHFRLPFSGTHEGIRTSDLPLRRRSLYPAELRGHMDFSQPRYCIADSAACQPRKQFPEFRLGQERGHRLLQIGLADTGRQIEALGKFPAQLR